MSRRPEPSCHECARTEAPRDRDVPEWGQTVALAIVAVIAVFSLIEGYWEPFA